VNSKVVAIAPHKWQVVDGFVSQWDGSIGRISKDGYDFAVFGMSDCATFYMPSVDDKVFAEVVQNKLISEYYLNQKSVVN
jgi:hypothetical protein